MFFFHALIISTRIPVYGKALNHFNIEPYLHVFDIYKKGTMFFEHASETITCGFDVLAGSFAYQLSFRS
jgi:hypothetical protein